MSPPTSAINLIPMVDAQPNETDHVDCLSADEKKRPDSRVEPDVIDSSQSVNQLKLDDSHHPIEPEPSAPSERPPTGPLEKKASSPLPGEAAASATSASSPLPSPQRLLNMPTLVDLSDLTLHSPSSQIIGTPFTTNTTRFEYPFPDTNPFSGSSLPPSYGGSPTSTALQPPLASGSSFPAISTSLSTSQITSPTLSYPLMSSETPSYNSAHPKLKAQTNPPIPPSLQKKRTKWSLNLLGRRKSSNKSQSSTGNGDLNGLPMVIDGASQVASPQGSPREERGNH